MAPVSLRRALAVTAACVLAGGAVTRAQSRIVPEPAQTMLVRDLGFTEGQLVLARNGQVVVRLLPAPSPKEVAVAGVTRIAVSRETFFDRYRDIERFKQHDAVKQLGRFSAPPAPADVAGLTFHPDLLDELRTCRPGDCKVKLPEAWMTRFRQQVNWSAPTARSDAQDLFRSLLVGYVGGYQAGGAAALVEYADKQPPVKLAEQSTALIQHSACLTAVAPDFSRYLIAYPRVPLSGVESFLYWSQEQFGLRPVVSVTHVAIFQDPARPNLGIGASRQIYASHYFEASLGLTIAVDDGEARPGIYLIYVNRTRADALTGSFGKVRRSVVHNRTREGVEETLAALKRRLEGGDR